MISPLNSSSIATGWRSQFRCRQGSRPARLTGMPRMHVDKLDLPVDLVHRLLAAQLPQWADLPVRRVASSGTDNAMFRLGDELVVRLPRIHWAAGGVDHEAVWLPRVAGRFPVEIPRVVAVGAPDDAYPWTWSVLTWVPGVNPVLGELREPEALARDLVRLVEAV